MKSLMIAVTAGDDARTRAVVAEALRLLAIHPARVHVVNVQPRVTGHVAMFFGQQELRQIQEDAGREALLPAQALLDAAGVKYSSHVLVGRSAECIAELARDLHCERILFGESGMMKVFGSLAQQVRHLLAGSPECEVIGS
jgi:nucleotide-binding universal stress UspA family protein